MIVAAPLSSAGATGGSVASGSVHFSDVSKLFGATRAFDGLELHIAHGELVVVVGPSGCGKTTALRMVAGLETLLGRKPGQLSGGQRQRVALGRAIARQTDVLLMDEPLSNLDAQLRQRAGVELSELHRRLGTTILYVTHDQVEAMTMGHRVAVMKDGVLLQCETPRQVYDAPANRFVAGFIGSPPMNLLPARMLTTADVDGAAHCSVTIGSMTRSLPSPLRQRLPAPSDVVLEIRPEHFDPVPTAFGSGGLDGVVRVVEPLGSDQFVTIECGEGSRVTARLRPNVAARVGEQIAFSSTLAGAHLFDPVSGDRIATVPPAG